LSSLAVRWWDHARLARPSDTGLAVVGTVVGAGLAGVPDLWSMRTLVVAASNACLSAGSMMVNDWHDVEEDRVNTPHRPVPSGAVPRRRALLMGAAALLVGIGLASSAGSRFGWLAAGVAFLSVGYTLVFKRWPGVGHVVTAGLSSYTLWCWAFEAGPARPLYAYVLGAYFVGTVGKEIARTAADLPGDARAGITTLATIFGARQANLAGLALICGGVALVWAPVLQNSGGIAYSIALGASTAAGGAILVRRRVLSRSMSARDTSRLVVSVTRGLTVAIVFSVLADFLLGTPIG